MKTAEHDIDDGRNGNTWRYAFDFRELSGSPAEGYLANLAAARFLLRPECGSDQEWTLDTGLSVDDVTEGDTIWTNALLRIEPASPLTVPPGQHFYALRLEWTNGDVLDVIEGHWTVGKSPFEAPS